MSIAIKIISRKIKILILINLITLMKVRLVRVVKTIKCLPEIIFIINPIPWKILFNRISNKYYQSRHKETRKILNTWLMITCLIPIIIPITTNKTWI